MRATMGTRASQVNCQELRRQLAHAERFARTLDLLLRRTREEDAAFVWLAGRGDEVRAFAGDVARSWMIGERSEEHACAAIESYLDALHRDLHPWFGEWYAPSCCGPVAHEPHEPHEAAPSSARSPSSGTQPVMRALAPGRPAIQRAAR